MHRTTKSLRCVVGMIGAAVVMIMLGCAGTPPRPALTSGIEPAVSVAAAAGVPIVESPSGGDHFIETQFRSRRNRTGGRLGGRSLL